MEHRQAPLNETVPSAGTAAEGAARRRRLPVSLRLVAYLFLLVGTAASAGTAVELLTHPVSLSPAVLGLPIGVGLLRLRGGWRLCALIYVWACVLSSAAAALLFLLNAAPQMTWLLGRPVGPVERWVGLPIAGFAMAVATWQLQVLRSPSVGALFVEGASARRPVPEERSAR